MIIRPDPANCTIVGGGVIGSAIALVLQAKGISTTLVEPGPQSPPASWGNAGHIATEQVEPLASGKTLRSFPNRLFLRGGPLGLPLREMGAWLPFALRMSAASRPKRFEAGKSALRGALALSIPAWRTLLRAAQSEALLRESGHYVAWESAARARSGLAAWTTADTGTARFRDASDGEMRLVAGLLSRPPAAMIRFLGTGQIDDLGELAARIEARFIAAGGTRVRASATHLQVDKGLAQIRLSDGADLAPEALVIAAGVGSGPLMRQAGYKVPIIAERGYHIQVADAGWPDEMPPVVFEDRSMIVTRFRSGLRAASFVEFARADAAPDVRKWERLEAHVRDLGLPFDGPIDRWMGARPTLPDYLPAIGRSPRARNLFYAFGHQHLGLTLAGFTAQAMAALVAGEEPPVDLAPFSLERFNRNMA